MSPAALVSTAGLLPASLPLVASGKVRDLYALADGSLLFVATDRISAYDAPLANGIPGKGQLLTQLTEFWLGLLAAQVPGLRTHQLAAAADLPAALRARSVRVRRLDMLPLEAIVRGHVSGSAWAEYARAGTVHGRALPAGLRESDPVPGGPIYTPSTKAPPGGRDENISEERAAELVGPERARRVKELALAVYAAAAAHAASVGIIVADTKLEFGVDGDGHVVLADEVLTPDSSRFWDAASFEPGRPQDSFDKQFVRDWLTAQGLRGKDNVVMPDDVVARTADKYAEAYRRLVGTPFRAT